MDSWSWCSVSQCSDQGPEHRPHPNRSLGRNPFQLPVPHTPKSIYCLDFWRHRLFCLFWIYANGIMRYECSCLPPSSNSSVFLCLVCWFSLLWSMPVVWILHSAFLHSAADGCLGHIQFGEYCVYSTAVNILKHSFGGVCMNFPQPYFWNCKCQTPWGSHIKTESKIIVMFRLNRNYETLPKWSF